MCAITSKIHGEIPLQNPSKSIYSPYDPKKPKVLGPKDFRRVKPGAILCKTLAPIENDNRLRSFHEVLQKELSIIDPNGLHQFAAVTRQKSRASKKMEVSANAGDLDYSARKDFLELNSSIPGRPIDLSPAIIADARFFIESALQRYTKSVNGDSVQEVLDLDHLVTLWRFGPGASRCTEARHFVDKLCVEKPTVTRNCLQLAKLIRLHNHRLRVIDLKTISDLRPDLNFTDVDWDELYDELFTVVDGSSLSTVTKNEDTRRTIATEPLMNMAAQLCAGAYVEGALRCVGLDISKQADLNKTLAQYGSLSGLLATLDLKSASDLIQLLLIKLLWPEVWYDLIIACRSPMCKVMPDGGYTELNMMSTMGNGFTFPVMTLTLLALVYACQSQRLKKSMFIDYATTGVFGDDIIVPKEDYNAVVNVLIDAGLLVNKDKSYSRGFFRESCGGDYVNGYDVTPFYVKSLANDPEVYSAINQISKWCADKQVYLVESLRHLVSMLDIPEKPLFVPFWDDPSSGIQTRMVSRRYRRWEPVPCFKYRDQDREIPEAMLLAFIGGYAASFGSWVEYVVDASASERTPFELCSAKLPKGYLDGGLHGSFRETEEDIINYHWISGIMPAEKQLVADD